MSKRIYQTKFGPIRRGETRPDGYHFRGFTNGYECWVSPQSWQKDLNRSRRESNKAYQRIRANPRLRSRKYELGCRWRQSHPAIVLLMSARLRAKKHHFACTITEGDIHIPRYCPALGIELIVKRGKGQSGRWNSPSLDRIDSRKGYTPNNIIVVSELANRIKTNATPEQILQVGKFYANLRSQS